VATRRSSRSIDRHPALAALGIRWHRNDSARGHEAAHLKGSIARADVTAGLIGFSLAALTNSSNRSFSPPSLWHRSLVRWGPGPNRMFWCEVHHGWQLHHYETQLCGRGGYDREREEEARNGCEGIARRSGVESRPPACGSRSGSDGGIKTLTDLPVPEHYPLRETG